MQSRNRNEKGALGTDHVPPLSKTIQDKVDFHFDDKKHIYYLNGKRMWGVTTVLSVVSKGNALINWSANMAVDYIDGFIKEAAVHADWDAVLSDGTWDRIAKEARVAHAKKRDKAADEGTDIHAEIEALVNLWKTSNDGWAREEQHPNPKIQQFIDWAVKENIQFIETEKQVYSPEMWTAGTIDLVFKKDGKLYIGDIKTYKKIWSRDPFLQCAGYGLMYAETTGEHIDGYCIINIPKDDNPFNVKWSFDIEGDSKGFLSALSLYKVLQQWN